MTAIPFTQYLMPDGRKVPVQIDRPDDVATKAWALITAGFRFECEMLRDYKTVSFTITDPIEGDDVDIELAENGINIPAAVDRLVTRFHDRHFKVAS